MSHPGGARRHPRRPFRRPKPRGNEPNFDLRTHLHRLFGVDLTTIPGIDVLTAHTLLTEVGPDLSKFPTPDAFASWLGLCPDNRISGGKVLSVKTRRVKNRAALALRMSAQAVQGSRAALGGYYRRMRAKLGGPKAITATAHKHQRRRHRRERPYDVWLDVIGVIRTGARDRERTTGEQFTALVREKAPCAACSLTPARWSRFSTRAMCTTQPALLRT